MFLAYVLKLGLDDMAVQKRRRANGEEEAPTHRRGSVRNSLFRRGSAGRRSVPKAEPIVAQIVLRDCDMHSMNDQWWQNVVVAT